MSVSLNSQEKARADRKEFRGKFSRFDAYEKFSKERARKREEEKKVEAIAISALEVDEAPKQKPIRVIKPLAPLKEASKDEKEAESSAEKKALPQKPFGGVKLIAPSLEDIRKFKGMMKSEGHIAKPQTVIKPCSGSPLKDKSLSLREIKKIEKEPQEILPSFDLIVKRDGKLAAITNDGAINHGDKKMQFDVKAAIGSCWDVYTLPACAVECPKEKAEEMQEVNLEAKKKEEFDHATNVLMDLSESLFPQQLSEMANFREFATCKGLADMKLEAALVSEEPSHQIGKISAICQAKMYRAKNEARDLNSGELEEIKHLFGQYHDFCVMKSESKKVEEVLEVADGDKEEITVASSVDPFVGMTEVLARNSALFIQVSQQFVNYIDTFSHQMKAEVEKLEPSVSEALMSMEAPFFDEELASKRGKENALKQTLPTFKAVTMQEAIAQTQKFLMGMALRAQAEKRAISEEEMKACVAAMNGLHEKVTHIDTLARLNSEKEETVKNYDNVAAHQKRKITKHEEKIGKLTTAKVHQERVMHEFEERAAALKETQDKVSKDFMSSAEALKEEAGVQEAVEKACASLKEGGPMEMALNAALEAKKAAFAEADSNLKVKQAKVLAKQAAIADDLKFAGEQKAKKAEEHSTHLNTNFTKKSMEEKGEMNYGDKFATLANNMEAVMSVFMSFAEYTEFKLSQHPKKSGMFW